MYCVLDDGLTYLLHGAESLRS